MYYMLSQSFSFIRKIYTYVNVKRFVMVRVTVNKILYSTIVGRTLAPCTRRILMQISVQNLWRNGHLFQFSFASQNSSAFQHGSCTKICVKFCCVHGSKCAHQSKSTIFHLQYSKKISNISPSETDSASSTYKVEFWGLSFVSAMCRGPLGLIHRRCNRVPYKPHSFYCTSVRLWFGTRVSLSDFIRTQRIVQILHWMLRRYRGTVFSQRGVGMELIQFWDL